MDGVSLKVLQQTMKMKMGATTSPSSCYFPLSQLPSMELCSVKDLESYLEEWLQNLVSLRKLKIYNCEELGSLPWIANLTSLQQLAFNSGLSQSYVTSSRDLQYHLFKTVNN